MCLISYAVFWGAFGRHPVGEGQKITKMTEKLMGPGFADLNDNTNASKLIMAKLPREELELTSDDGINLKGYLFKNAKATDKTAICVHGYNSTGFLDFATVGLEYLNRGYNLLLVTNRACGSSGGKWTGFGILERKDTAKWTERIAEIYPEGDIILHGCSLGGATVCMMSDMTLPKNVKALVSDCAFGDLKDELTHMFKYMAHLPAFPLLNLVEKWCKAKAGYGFSDNSPFAAVAKAEYPMLFAHGIADRYIPYQTAEKLYALCPTEKELLLIEGAGHAAAQLRGGKEKYFDPLFAFLAKYVNK